MLNRGQLVDRLVELGAGDRKHVNNMLRHLETVAAEEIGAGNDFTIPGIVRLSFTYAPAQKKGERWRKGETVAGFGGVETTKEEDSPARKARVKLRAVPTGAVGRLKPGSRPEAQAEFLKSKAGRAVAKRKAR